MKRHMIICLFISMLVGMEKELGSYKDRRYLLGMKHGSWAWIQSIYELYVELSKEDHESLCQIYHIPMPFEKYMPSNFSSLK